MFFQLLQLVENVDEPELVYPMRCNAALAYADECSTSNSSFRLPAQLLSNYVNESASTENCKKEYAHP